MLNSFREKFGSILIYVTAAVLAAVSFFRIHAYQDPSGGDGYFYLKQTEWLISHFEFYHADYSFVFFPLALLTKLFSSSLTAYQFLSCLNYFIILSSLGLFSLAILSNFKLYQKIALSVLLVIALGYQMPILRVSFEFVKNGFAISLLLLSGLCALNKKIKSSVLLALLAALTHKTVALFLILLAILVFLKKRTYIVAAGIVAVLIALANPRLLKHIQAFVERISLENLNSLFAFNFHLTWSHVLLIAFWVVVFLSRYKEIKNHKAILATMFAFAIFPLIPIFGETNLEIKWRLMIVTFILSFILYMYSLQFFVSKKVIVSTLIVTFSLFSYELWNDTGFPWIISSKAQVPNIEILNDYVKPGEELITHHGMQFYVDYKTPIRAKSLLSATLPKYQLAYVPEFFLLDPSIADEVNQVKLATVGPSYGLFYYEDFQQLMKRYGILRHWKNEYKIRPDFVQSY